MVRGVAPGQIPGGQAQYPAFQATREGFPKAAGNLGLDVGLTDM